MKWILRFISFFILWSFIFGSYTAFSAPIFQTCMGLVSKIGGKRHKSLLSIQEKVKRLTSNYMSMTIRETSEYDKAIKNVDQLKNEVTEHL